MATPEQIKIEYRDFGDSNGDLVLACGFCLFINGVDVSDHVMGSISWSYAGRVGENACSFTLDNNNDKFVLRPSNLGLSEDTSSNKNTNGTPGPRNFSDTESFATSQPWKITVFNKGNDPVYVSSASAEQLGFTTYSETAKRKLYLDKLKKRVTLAASVGGGYNIKSYTDKETGAVSNTPAIGDMSLYEGLFSTKSQVINIMDQVRLYVPDPNFDSVELSESRWINVFTGFVSSAPAEHDFSTGQSSISVSCSDIRTLLKRKRVLVNSSSADQITPSISMNNGMFSDVTLANQTTSNAFADQSLSFEGLIALALTGIRIADNAGSTSVASLCMKYNQQYPDSSWLDSRNAAQPQRTNKNGFGALWFGYYYQYETSYSKDTKTEGPTGKIGYNDARSAFMNSWNRLCTFGALQEYLSWNAMQLQGERTRPDGKESALNALIHFLVPTGGNQVTTLLDRTWIDQMGAQREYMSVGEIIEQVCERLDYHYTVSGTGDLVFEFPMYDFHAHDMGEEFKNIYSVSDSVKNHTINDESNSNPITALKVVGGYTDQQNSPDGVAEQTINYLYTVHLVHDLMSCRYGYAEEEYAIPFITKGPRTGESADIHLRKLILFGTIEFLKRLTEMSSLSISAGYNPFARPNRPYYYNYGRRLALTDTVSNTLSLFQNAETTVDSKYVRRIHDITGEVIAFGGSMGLPLNYSNKESMDSYLSPFEFGIYETAMFNAGINILVPSGTGGIDANGKLVPPQFNSVNSNKTANARVCAWSADDKAALDRLCLKQGAKPADILMILGKESSYDHFSVNTTPIINAKGEVVSTTGTRAMGLNNMMPMSIIETITRDAAQHQSSFTNPRSVQSDGLLAKYPGAAALLDQKFQRARSNGKGNWVPDSMKPEFVSLYMSIFNTPAAQLDMYDAFLDNCKAISNVNQDFQYDSLEKLSTAQVASGNLKNAESGRDTALDAKAVEANAGKLTSAYQYASDARRSFGNSVGALYDSINSGCGNAVPTAVLVEAKLGGVGEKLAPLATPRPLPTKPKTPPTQIVNASNLTAFTGAVPPAGP